MCEYTVHLASKHACPVRAGAKRGWAFVITFTVCVLIYIGVGVGIRYHKFGLRGAEAIPNIEYWRELPGLVVDGVKFSATHTKEGSVYVYERFVKPRLPPSMQGA